MQGGHQYRRKCDAPLSLWKTLPNWLMKTELHIGLQKCKTINSCENLIKAYPEDQRRASELPWDGDIPLTIHTTAIFSHSNAQRITEGWCRIWIKCYISSCIWQAQVIGMWGHSTEILQTGNIPSWHIWQGTRSCTHPGWWSSHLCIQSTHTHRAALCKQWMGTTCLCLWCRMFWTYIVNTSQLRVTSNQELFTEHGIPESIRSDNGPQFSSHLFKEFTEEWNFTHHTSSPINPCSDGQAESAVKFIKGLLTRCAEDLYLACLAYRSTLFGSHLRSPGELLHQHVLCTTVPWRIKHQDPHATAECESLEDCADQSAANHEHTGCCKKAPIYARQTVSVLSNDRTLWFPATVVHTADHRSYIVKVTGGAEYRWACDYTCECHPDAVKSDMHSKVEVPEHPASIPSAAAAKQAVPTAAVKVPTAPTAQPSVAPTTPCKLQPKALQTPASADVQQTGRTDVTLHRSACTIKAPQCLIEHM